jgi:hypothetical protein
MMRLREALDRIEQGYGGIQEVTVVRNTMEAIAAFAQEGMMAWLDHDLTRIRLQLKRIKALAGQCGE